MATCAICLTPIAGGQKMKIIDTEVIHATCAIHLVHHRTRGQRDRVAVEQLAADLERERRAFADANHRAATADARAKELERQVSNLRANEGHVVDNLEGVLREVDALKHDREGYRRARDRIRVERDAAIVERDAARRELALHQTIGAGIAPQTAPSGSGSPQTPERDATEIRFSLLELDKS